MSGPTRCAITATGRKQTPSDIDRDWNNKKVGVRLPLLGDCNEVMGALLQAWKKAAPHSDTKARQAWWRKVDAWRARNCLRYDGSRRDLIKPQYALERPYALTREPDPFITTEVGQPQMWRAPFFKFDK